MNGLLSKSFVSRSDHRSPSPDHRIINIASTAPSAGDANLDIFFGDVEAIKDEMKEPERISKSLKSHHEENKTVHDATAVKHLRSRMDADVALALKKAKLLKLELEALDRSNDAARGLFGCWPGSSSDRTRTSVVNGLKKKLKDSMDAFNDIRQQISAEYRETVQRRYFTVTGENPDDKTVELLIATGGSETFLQKAIQEQGRGRILDTINEIQERHDAVKELERSLKELRQVFLDMAVLVQSQGEHLNDIESYVTRASSFVRTGAQELQTAKKHQKNTRKWTCYAIILLLVIVLFVVLVIVRPWQHKGSDGKN